MSPAVLVAVAHWDALEIVSFAGGSKYQGLHQASRDLAHWLSPGMKRRGHIVADSSALLRHVTFVSVSEFVHDLRGELAVPLADAERRGVQASTVDTNGQAYVAAAATRLTACVGTRGEEGVEAGVANDEGSIIDKFVQAPTWVNVDDGLGDYDPEHGGVVKVAVGELDFSSRGEGGCERRRGATRDADCGSGGSPTLCVGPRFRGEHHEFRDLRCDAVVGGFLRRFHRQDRLPSVASQKLP